MIPTNTTTFMHITHYFKPGEILPGEGAWVFLLKTPVSPDLSPAELINAFYETGYLAAYNDAFADMYGFEQPDELMGLQLSVFMPPSNNIFELLETMIKNGFKLENGISKEQDHVGKPIYFQNKMEALFDNGLIIGGKGTQIPVEKP